MNQQRRVNPDYRHVVVVGAGYAGIMAANRLATNPTAPKIHVTLVNPVDVFVERIRLHEVAAGSRTSATHPLHSMLCERVTVMVGTITAIRPDAQEAETADGTILSYDALIYAAGSGAATPPTGMSGVSRWQDATELRTRLDQSEAGSRVVVIGGGLTGIETVAECAQQHPALNFSLVTTGELAPSVGTAARNRLRQSLRSHGVEVLENATPMPAVAAEQLKQSLGADELVWAVGFEFPDLAALSGLDVDDQNRLIVDSALRSISWTNIFGAGDATAIAAPHYEYLRSGCAAALPQGAQAADSVLAMFAEHSPTPLSMGYMMQAISAGRGDGAIQFVDANDSPRRLHLHGRLAAFTKETICRMTMKWMRDEAHKHGSFTWPNGATIHEEKGSEVVAKR